MNRTWVTLALLIVPLIGYAPIMGTFSGIDVMKRKSGSIAVIRVYQKKREDMFGGFVPYEVEVEKVLMGEKIPERLEIELRYCWIPTKTEREEKAVMEYEFSKGSRHLVFLHKGQSGKWRNLNMQGSHFEISPYQKLAEIEGKDFETALAILSDGFIRFRQLQLKHIQERTDILLTKDRLPKFPADPNAVTNTQETIKPKELTKKMIGKQCTVYVHGPNFDKSEPQMPSKGETQHRGVLSGINEDSISLTEQGKSPITIERARIRKLIIKNREK